ncbi:hypothetical protein F2Q68_00025540 [Brassica cretica]|uniref:Uncharacterized protein n=1 Tax=Brassica cretica TaxID=69181 RepID=A0A8S9II89_BRACR|nr:hypothetical protein F2Q68_00025540 [Brassica cretica]
MDGFLPDAGVGRGLSLMFQKRRRTHTEDSSDVRLVYRERKNNIFLSGSTTLWLMRYKGWMSNNRESPKKLKI